MKRSSFIPLLLVGLFVAGIPAGALADENTDGGIETMLSNEPAGDLRAPVGAGSLPSEESSRWGKDVEVYEWGGLKFRVGIDDTP